MADRDLDVVLFGASSVTGRQTGVYLQRRAAELGLTWAAAGRDPARVQSVLAEAGAEAPEVLTADVADPASLEAMAGRAKVVLNLVGPYTRFGRPTIEACITSGAHYVDLTGEIPFVAEVIADLEEAARGAGVKVVQVCGFEALPFDLAVRLADEAARERHGDGLAWVDLAVTAKPPPGRPRATDLISGGTAQSVVEITGHPNAAAATDPAALLPGGSQADEVRRVSPIGIAPWRAPGGAVAAPMTPSPFINPAVIHRSAALAAEAGDRELRPFRYREGTVVPGSGPALPLGYAAAGALSGMQAGLRAIARSRPGVRRRAKSALAKVMPGSGFGPRPDRLEGWRWQVRLKAGTSGGQEVGVTVDAEGHPGYLATSKMMGEAGLALAEDGATPGGAGCLPPAIALGTGVADRMAEAGVRFRVD